MGIWLEQPSLSSPNSSQVLSTSQDVAHGLGRALPGFTAAQPQQRQGGDGFTCHKGAGETAQPSHTP